MKPKVKTVTEETEASVLVGDAADLINIFITDFVKHCTQRGYVTLSKESDRFEVTVTLKRKKEKK